MTPTVEPEELVDLAHPFGVALGEVVVDGDDVDAAAGERVEIDRQRRDQRLAFAGLHLGDLALVQHHAADELHVEMALAERALGGLAHGGEGRHQQIVERGAVGELLLELVGARAQRLVGERLELRLQRVDGVDARLIGLTRRSLEEPKSLRATAPIIRDCPIQVPAGTAAAFACARMNCRRMPE